MRLGGLFKHHSRTIILEITLEMITKHLSVNQGYLDTASPSVNCL